MSRTVAAGMEWAAEQDWIDVISVSIGIPANAGSDARVHDDVARYLAASEAAVRSGKLVVTATGNDPTPVLRDHFDGPPWVIAVGGLSTETQGESALSAKFADVVANFTDFTPYYGAGEMTNRSGTSLAAPIVAGTLARALAMVRAEDPARVISPGEARAALNASALLLGPTDWRPTPPPATTDPGDLFDGVVRYSSLPVVLPTQMGWGYVDSSLADEIARRLLDGDLDPPQEKETIARSQAQWQQARETYWRS